MAEAETQEVTEAGAGALDGEVLTLDDASNVTQKANFKNGKLEGETVLYDEAGAVVQRIGFKEGLMNGEMEFFQKNVLL